MVASALLMF